MQRTTNNLRNNWKSANFITDRVLIGVLVVIMFLGAYVIYDTVYAYGLIPDNLAYYFEGGNENWDKMPDNAVGWLSVYDTYINYPVMQGEDNEEYLNKNEYGEFALAGSIFLDFRNDPEWKDTYNLLYGHHMSANRMFGSLDNFLDKEYFKTHRLGMLKTRGADYELHIFAAIKDSASNRILFDAGSDAKTEEIPGYIKKHASIYTEPDGEKILAMSTCQEVGSTSRLIVFATMHVAKEPGTLYDEDELVQPGQLVKPGA